MTSPAAEKAREDSDFVKAVHAEAAALEKCRRRLAREQARTRYYKDALAAERARAEKLEEALTPFVDATDFYTGDTDNDYSLRVKGIAIRNAREALGRD